jgi:hypothetical protein
MMNHSVKTVTVLRKSHMTIRAKTGTDTNASPTMRYLPNTAGQSQTLSTLMQMQTKIGITRYMLCALSQEAKAFKSEMLREATTVDDQFFVLSLSVNDILLAVYEVQTGCKEFRTFRHWQREGYRVKKGEKAFRIWARARKASDTHHDNRGGYGDANGEGWPTCCVFNENQVERMDDDNSSRGS